MPDDDRGNEQDPEQKITVRDRRRVTFEGELREVEGEPAAPPTPPPAEQTPPPPPPPPSSAEPPRQRSSGGALGGADRARARRGERSRLREVPPEQAAAQAETEGDETEGAPRVSNLYEYLQAVAAEMIVWTLASLGLMPNPMTRIVTTDMAQAEFGLDAAENLLDLLVAGDAIDPEDEVGFRQGFVFQFCSVAAQLLQQPPQVRLQESSKIRFCIDAADRFLEPLDETKEGVDPVQLAELRSYVNEVRLAFVQATGGGGIIG